MITAVEHQNPILFQIDEFGRFMHCIKAGPMRNPHSYNIAGVLLKFYGKAGSVFRSKAYADAKRNKVIEQPHVCVYGTTVRSGIVLVGTSGSPKFPWSLHCSFAHVPATPAGQVFLTFGDTPVLPPLIQLRRLR